MQSKHELPEQKSNLDHLDQWCYHDGDDGDGDDDDGDDDDGGNDDDDVTCRASMNSLNRKVTEKSLTLVLSG